MTPGRFDEFSDDDLAELERQLEQEIEDLPLGDREDAQRRPHLAYLVLYTADVEGLADFYCGCFGFDRSYETGSTVELQAGNLALAITDEGQMLDVIGLHAVPTPHEGRVSHTILVENVEQCYEAALALGAERIREPHDTDWGMRSCWVRDPAGHLLEIGRYVR